jgi:photosystem II stability/assembly factor-like uncharacterized protein
MKMILILITLVVLLISTLNADGDKWKKMNGPAGGTVYSFFIKGDTIIAATRMGYYGKGIIYYSLNKGINWTQADLKLKTSISGVYITSNGTAFFSTSSDGIYISHDYKTWTKIRNGEFNCLNGFDNTVYIAGKKGIYRFNDDGTNWSLAHNPGYDREVYNIFIDQNKTVYFGTNKMFIKKKLNDPNFYHYFVDLGYRLKIFSYDSLLYSYSYSQLAVSSDEGLTWQKLDTTYFFKDRYINSITYVNNKLIASASDSVLISEDNGYTWRTGSGRKLYSVELQGEELFAGSTRNGFLNSTDYGETWNYLNNGLNTSKVEKIIIDEEGVTYTASSVGFSRSFDKGESWEEINNGINLPNAYLILLDKHEVLYAGGYRGLFKSTNRGDEWQHIPFFDDKYVYKSFVDDSNHVYVEVFLDKLYKSRDNGLTWDKIETGITEKIASSAIDDNNNLYIGTEKARIFKSTNRGDSWNIIYTAPAQTGWIRDIVVHNRTVYATNDNIGILRSIGNFWDTLNTGLPSTYLNTLVRGTDGSIYTATRYGNYAHNHKVGLFKLNGDSWKDVTGNLYLTEIRSIAFDKEENLYLATDEGVWKTNTDIIVTDIPMRRTVDNFALLQNYPNPFNPITKIQYQVPRAEFITLKIYDVLGNEVTTLVNEAKEPGEYEIDFNGSKLSSGVYFYTLRSGSFYDTKKFILMR